MNKHSRTTNTIFNFIGNLIYQGVLLILAFATRRVFINTLGVEYLGVNGLFTNIITVLSLAELGVGNAIYYSMYKHIANNNKKKLIGLTSYYKTLYNKIALIVLLIGLSILPFLRFIVKLDNEMPYLEVYYLITLLSSVTSYLFVYKTSIVHADQSSYKLKWLNIATQFFKAIIGILILIFVKNYILYISVELVIAVLGNYICSKYAEKLYPFIKEKENIKETEKKKIWDNIKDMFFYKLSSVILNNTDNIIISIMCGTGMVGYYSNYTMIFNKIFSVISMFFGSFNSSIGNLNADSSTEKKYTVFKVINFLSFWIFSFACIGVLFVGEDVIRIMSGQEKFVLGKDILIMSILVFYLKVSKNAISLYRDTTGLFKLSKYALLCSAGLNIILSFVFGYWFGLFGILLATFVSRMVSDVWYEPYILYKKIFNKKVYKYYLEQILYFLITIFEIMLLLPIINLIKVDNLYVRTFIEFAVCMIFPNLFYFILFRKREEFKFVKEKIIYAINKTIKFRKVKNLDEKIY